MERKLRQEGYYWVTFYDGDTPKVAKWQRGMWMRVDGMHITDDSKFYYISPDPIPMEQEKDSRIVKVTRNEVFMNKHTERLNQMAERMANVKYGVFVKFDTELGQKLLAEYSPLAELALRECAEEVNGAIVNMLPEYAPHTKDDISELSYDYLQSRGLIPAKTKE